MQICLKLLVDRIHETTLESSRFWIGFNTGWVKPILNMPSKDRIGEYISTNHNENPKDIKHFGRIMIPVTNEAVLKVNGTDYAPEDRTYMDGTTEPRKIEGAQYMGALNGAISFDVFEETTSTQGHDSLVFGPSLDFTRTGQMFDEDGAVYNKDTTLNAWKEIFWVWVESIYRVTPFVLQPLGAGFNKESLEIDLQVETLDTDIHVDIVLRVFKMRYDRFARFDIDQDLFNLHS